MRILVVEDNAMFRSVLRRSLVWFGHTVYEAADVETAKDLLDVFSDLDVVIVDWFLPDGTGGDLLVWVRARSPRLKVVLCSGLDNIPHNDFDAVYLKPVDVQQIAASLEKLKERPANVERSPRGSRGRRRADDDE